MQKENLQENIIFGSEARSSILEGAEILNKAVSATLGPKGKLVLIENIDNIPTLTKDGITVARAVNLKDKFKKIGCDTIKNASEKTLSEVGDGTTSTILLATAILKEGIKLINSGHSTNDLKAGIDYAINAIINDLKQKSLPIRGKEDIKNIAKISSNNSEEIGNIIADALEHSGQDGVAVIEYSNSFNSCVEFIKGMQIERGFISPYFVTNNDKMTCELKDPLIFISTKKLSSIEETINILEEIRKYQRSVLFIGEEVDSQFLQTLITNKLRGVLNSCAILAPGIGESKFHFMEDIATITGGKFITDSSGFVMSKPDMNFLGSCEKVIVGRHTTTFVGGAGKKDLIQKRIEDIKEQLNDPTLDAKEKNFLKVRAAKLIGGVSVIRVGGATEIEIKEKYDRFEDALCASKASLIDGILPGGGISYIRSSSIVKAPENSNDGFKAGVASVKNACLSILRKIISNGELDSPDVVINSILEMPPEFGMDYSSGKYCNLLQNGIVDPTSVIISVLRNASSAASLLLFVDVLISLDESNVFQQ